MAKTSEKKDCLACKVEHAERPISEFYASKSPMHRDGKLPWCKNCIAKFSLSEDGSIINENFKNVLCQIGKPYYIDILYSCYAQYKKQHMAIPDENIKLYGKQIIGLYFKNLNSLPQNQEDSYIDSEKSGFYKGMNTAQNNFQFVSESKNVSELEHSTNIKWSKKDKQNMNYVISTVGYDPFEELELTESDRKYCFNIMAGYCDTDGIVEDGNKMQGVIEITNMYCQCKNFTAAINAEMNKNNPDNQKISKLTNSKASMLSSISTIAKDNNISSNYNKNSKQGQNSITSKMKEMEENDFEMIKVNLFDIKTSEAFKQIADLSNQSIMEQLTFDNNDYTQIVKEQNEMIQKYESDIDILKEENRNLKNKIIDLESRKR